MDLGALAVHDKRRSPTKSTCAHAGSNAPLRSTHRQLHTQRTTQAHRVRYGIPVYWTRDIQSIFLSLQYKRTHVLQIDTVACYVSTSVYRAVRSANVEWYAHVLAGELRMRTNRNVRQITPQCPASVTSSNRQAIWIDGHTPYVHHAQHHRWLASSLG